MSDLLQQANATKQAEQQKKPSQKLMENFQALDQQAIRQMDETQGALLTIAKDKYDRQQSLLVTGKRLPVNVPRQRAVKQVAEIPSPELSEKKQSRRLKRRQKNLEKGQALTKDATYFTKEILDAEKKRQKDAAKHPDSGNADFTELKAEVLSKEYNHNVFKTEYFGEHYREVREEIRRLRAFLNAATEGSPEFDSLNEMEQEKTKVLSDVCDQMEDAYFSALEVNGLRQNERGELEPYETHSADEKTLAATRYAAHVSHLEETLKDSDARLWDQMSDRQEDMISAKETELRNEIKVMQDTMHEEHPEVPGDYYSPYQYEDIAKYMSWIDAPENAERYAANKDAVDAILRDFIRLSQVNSEASIRYKCISDAISDLQLKYQGKYTSQWGDANDVLTYNVLMRKATEMEPKQEAYTARLQYMMMAMRHLIKGEANDSNAVWKVMKEYGVQEAAQVLRTQSNPATMYPEAMARRDVLLREAIERKFPGDAEKMKQFTTGTLARMINLMKDGDNEYNDKVLALQVKRAQREKEPDNKALTDEVAREAYAIAAPKFEAIMRYDLKNIDALTDDELLEKQSEILELITAGQMLSDLAKDPSDVPGLTVREKILGKPTNLEKPKEPELEGLSKEDAIAAQETYERALMQYQEKLAAFEARKTALSDKIPILDALKIRIRGIAILKSIDSLDDPNSALTQAEIERGKAEQLAPDGTAAEQVILYARRLINDSKNQVPAYEENFLKDENVRTYLVFHKMPKTEEVHEGTAINKRIHEAVKERVKQGLSKDEPSAFQDMYREAKEKNDTKMMEELSIVQKLSDRRYRMAGDTRDMIGEPVFRAYGSSETIPTIREMDAETYHTMLVNMSAGAFLDETAAPEEVQEAREKNKQGLRTYYDHMVPHYEMLEKKYGHELPDLMWVVQNYDEFLKDFANPQVDNNLVTHDTDVLNREDEKDLRAISLVQFYNSYCGAILVGIARIQNSESFPIKDMDEVRGFMKQFLSKDDNYQKNLDFLKAHPINDGGEAE